MKAQSKRWFYNGDIDIKHGGTYYRLDTANWGHVGAVRVTPCSDADGPDNMFWVEQLVVNLPSDPDRREEVLGSCGWLPNQLPKGRAGLHMLVQACLAYGTYDHTYEETVQTGKRREGGSATFDTEPDTILRSNANVRRYVRRKWLRNL